MKRECTKLVSGIKKFWGKERQQSNEVLVANLLLWFQWNGFISQEFNCVDKLPVDNFGILSKASKHVYLFHSFVNFNLTFYFIFGFVYNYLKILALAKIPSRIQTSSFLFCFVLADYFIQIICAWSRMCASSSSLTKKWSFLKLTQNHMERKWNYKLVWMINEVTPAEIISW